MKTMLLSTGLTLCLPLCVFSATPEQSFELSTDSTITLSEIVVKARIPMAKVRNNSIQVRVKGTNLATTGTALEVLGKMPFVSLTGNEIEVIGKGTPLIYINGRQVRDSSELDRLASSEIKNIEIITNPGAQYASTANAVIRITTIPPIGEGVSVSDRTTVGYKHYAYLFQQTNFNYRKSGLDIFAMLNYENYRERPAIATHITKYLPSATVTQLGSGRENVKYPVYQGKIGGNYAWKQQNIGLYYDFSFRPSDTSSDNSAISRYIDGTFSEHILQNYDVIRHNRQHLLSAYYNGKVAAWELSANFDVLWQNNDRHSDEGEQSSAYQPRIFSTAQNVTNRLIAANVSATTPLWKGKLSFGTEITNIHRADSNTSDADFIESCDNKIQETTTALFATTSQTFGRLAISAGLRWEYTDSRYYLYDIIQPDQSRDYHNLSPSASLSLPICRVATNLSYSRKISRPTFAQLSSAVKYLDRYSYETGSPSLRPIYRDYLSLSASWRDLVVSLDYCSMANYFMWETSVYPSHPGVTLLQIQNMPRFNTFSAMANYSPTFGCYHPSFMASVEYQDFTLRHNGTQLKLNHPIGAFRSNNAIHLPADIWVNVDLSATTSGDSGNCHIQSSWQCDLGIYKAFANDRWSLKLQLNDLFDTYRQQITS